MSFSTIEDAIEEIRAGRMVVVCDDEDRENEGDLTMAAQFATPEAINFMAKEGRGLICLSLTPQRCDELGLDLMAAKNESPFDTPFTVTIEARDGVFSSIGLFETPEQGKESSNVVATWIRDEKLDTMIPNEPKITMGKVIAHSNGITSA